MLWAVHGEALGMTQRGQPNSTLTGHHSVAPVMAYEQFKFDSGGIENNLRVFL